MNYLNLKVQADDYPFIVAAIKLRTTAILEGLSMQVDAQLQPQSAPAHQPPPKPKAPYGLKKDGTPKKRPGRPAK
jgi:hypothetical protein